ncbi:MAG: glycosyltransferase family 39 protein [Chloroflexi bacterium]|nr:glycosyltransferase family 39 protein [Chloroflexota bacterium]
MEQKHSLDLISGVDPIGSSAGRYPSPASQFSQGTVAVQEKVRIPAPRVRVPALGTATRARLITMVALSLGIFLLAAVPRLYFLFSVSDPQNPGLGWYGDTFHHWQIAYLSKEVGFSHGFLRLWDFKGMEYVWGLLHPLLLAIFFTITGSVDIVIPRLVSLAAGSGSVVILFLLAQRYFNRQVALAAALLAALNPVGIFNDPSGMQEPLGIVLLWAGLALWPKNSTGTGILWALAGMVRSEYWLFGFGLAMAAMLAKEDSHRKLALGLGWGIPSLLYMKYLLDYTGNPIYPFYWSFMGNAAGAWMADVPLNPEQTTAQGAFRGLALIMGVGALWLIWKRPRYYLLFLLGLGNLLFLSLLLGFTAYIRGFLPRFMVDRIFLLPYMFLGVFLAALVLYWLPRPRFRSLWLSLGWAVILAVLAASQWAWNPIWQYFGPAESIWKGEQTLASEIAQEYKGGVISIPEDRPWLTYLLVHDHRISGRYLEGQMYDPFAYFVEDPFANWSESREEIRAWLEGHDIRLLVFYSGKENYEEMIRREPELFRFIKESGEGMIQIYEVRL